MPQNAPPVLCLLGTGTAVNDIQLTLDVEQSEFCTIGRSQDNTLCLPIVPNSDHAHLSRRHCEISFASDLAAWIVEDCGSTNGTAIVDGASNKLTRLSPRSPRPLRVNDQLVLAGCDHFNFLVQAPSSQANAPEALEQTIPLLRARQSCLQIIDQGGNRGVVPLPAGAMVSLCGGTASAAPSPSSLSLRGFPPRSQLGMLTVTPSTVTLSWLPAQPILCNNLPLPVPAILTDGDILTFPSSPGLALLLHFPSAATNPSPFSSLALAEAKFTVGRDPGNDVVLAHPSISRHHARFIREGSGWRLEDLAPSGATLVNGHPPADSVLLSIGDRLTLGFRTWLIDSPEASQGPVPIELQCVDASYQVPASGRPKTLLHPLNFRVARGELLGIIGPSGSGKSTLLNLLAGKATPTSGRILINGRSLHEPANHRRFSRWMRSFSSSRSSGAGYVEQHDLVYPNLSTLNLLLRSGVQAGLSPAACQARANEVLKLCQIEEIASRIIVADGRQTVSGGQLKRICIAVALMQNSSTLLVDEPISPLDHSGKTEFLELFRSLAQHGTTVILTIHDIHYLNYCHKILAVALGRLLYFGEPAHLESFFGVPRIEEVLSRLPRFVDRPEDQQAAIAAEARFRSHAFYAEHCATSPPNLET